MAQITVVGGTGFAGSAIVAVARDRGHEVTAFSRSAPSAPTADVTYVQGDVDDAATLRSIVNGSSVVVSALAPRGPLLEIFRDVNRTIGRLADAAGARLFVVGGYSSLRPSPGAPRFIDDLSDVPEAVRDEVLAGAAVVIEDLPAGPPGLEWIFVSPALRFGAHVTVETVGHYELGDEVAVEPVTGGEISAADYALGLVDLIDDHTPGRRQVNLGNPV